MGRMEVTKIVDGLYVIPVGPVHAFLLDSPDGCALIDTGVSGSAAAILRALHALGKQPTDVRHILLTHAHPDHIGSLAALKKVTAAEAYIHPLDADIATNGAGFRPMSPAPGLVTGMMFQMFVRPVETVEPRPSSILYRRSSCCPLQAASPPFMFLATARDNWRSFGQNTAECSLQQIVV
jgi:glyoxylase-like metal-dependent hydrolase (beta-lactamase superfamily II)